MPRPDPRVGRAASLQVRRSARFAAVSAALCTPVLALAGQHDSDPTEEVEEVIVTATRRTENIQDVPFNISAVSGEQLEKQGLSRLAEIARTVPGFYVVDQGVRASNRIVMRGLNVSTINASEALGNSGGDSVSTYVGEIPLYIDLKPDDIERIEVLKGPQGTLYGAGTLAGAVRYIPRRPQLDAATLHTRVDAYDLDESSSLGTDVGFTANLPINDRLAFRATLGYLDDPGFVDYNYLVREVGVSDPEPDFSDPAAVAANLRRKKDVDDEQTLSARAALRFQPTDTVDANLTYYYQNQETGGRTMDQRAAFDTPKYVSAMRVTEPNERENQLLALELTADLGFAELISATGGSRYKEHGRRDQTDLLIALEYGYEGFPSFTAFTRDSIQEKRFNQELRLVSTGNSRWDWIVGAFYNRLDSVTDSKEFTPGYAEYRIPGGIPGEDFNADALEYFSRSKFDLKELAGYGELRYRVTEAWQITVGARWYRYEFTAKDDAQLPLFAVDVRPWNFLVTEEKHDGTLFKFNTSYDFTDDVMAYLTVSEGYRIGGSNGLVPCGPGAPPICGQPDELTFKPDKTMNYELGVRTQWLGRQLTVNGSLFYVDWRDPQLGGTSEVAAIPITINGEGARARGLELSIDARPTDAWTVQLGYAYVDAELTDLAPNLLNTFIPPGWSRIDVDGEKGDRLPGSPKHQGALWTSYNLPALISGYDLELSYGLTAQSNIITKVGKRADGETLGGFAVHHAAATLRAQSWSLSLYAENLFNKYAYTGVRSTPVSNQTVTDDDGNPVRVRSYYHDLLRPRQVGLRFTYDFSL